MQEKANAFLKLNLFRTRPKALEIIVIMKSFLILFAVLHKVLEEKWSRQSKKLHPSGEVRLPSIFFVFLLTFPLISFELRT